MQLGAYRLLFSAPEAIVCWRELLLEQPLCHQVVAVVVDEAYCVYKWSKEFRPAYSCLHELRALVSSGVPMTALTATITNADAKTQLIYLTATWYVYHLTDSIRSIFGQQVAIKLDVFHAIQRVTKTISKRND